MKIHNREELLIEDILAEESLPEGWVLTTLGDVCKKITDGTHRTPKYIDNGIPFVSTANIIPFVTGFDFNSYRRFITPEEHNELIKRCSPEKGDILVSKCGTIGRTKEVDVDYPFSIFVGLALLKPYKGIFSHKFPEYLLNYEPITNEFEKLSPGSTRKTLTLTAIKTLRLPLPPVAEQKRIVAKAEELLARVNATKERLSKVLLILKRFRQAVLSAACSGRLTADWRDKKLHTNSSNQPLDGNEDLPSSWSWKSIRDLASSKKGSIQSGPFGSNLLHSEFQPTGILVIGIDNVLDSKFSFGKQHRISHQKYELLKKYAARPLDVLVTVMATVGRCCVVPSDIETAIITKHVYRITADHAVVNPYYLMQCIRGCPAVLAQVQSEIQGVTRPGINGAILKGINIPLPPITEQHEIVRRVETLFNLANTIEKRVAAASLRAEKLTQAILAKAFRGEMVPTEAELAHREGRSYEPASVLLARIKFQSQYKRGPGGIDRIRDLQKK